MNCEQAREGIERGEESDELRLHADRCGACRGFRDQREVEDRQWSLLLGTFSPKHSLAGPILARLPTLTKIPSRQRWIKIAVLAGAAAAAIPAIFLIEQLANPGAAPPNDPSVQPADVSHEGTRNKVIFLDKTRQVKMEFVWIKPGKFMMGSPADEKDRQPNETLHQVTITKGFWMQTTEVTQAQWEAVMGSNPSYFKGDPNLPVDRVSWEDCQEFLKKLNDACKDKLGRLRAELPTEAEWEYACRAGSTGRWSFGNDEARHLEYAWDAANAGIKTHLVGQRKPNAWGLYDLHGNVSEWCKDWYGEYEEQAFDPQGPANGEYRVLRGGSWVYYPQYLRSAYRNWLEPGQRQSELGGRAVLR